MQRTQEKLAHKKKRSTGKRNTKQAESGTGANSSDQHEDAQTNEANPLIPKRKHGEPREDELANRLTIGVEQLEVNAEQYHKATEDNDPAVDELYDGCNARLSEVMNRFDAYAQQPLPPDPDHVLFDGYQRRTMNRLCDLVARIEKDPKDPRHRAAIAEWLQEQKNSFEMTEYDPEEIFRAWEPEEYQALDPGHVGKFVLTLHNGYVLTI